MTTLTLQQNLIKTEIISNIRYENYENKNLPYGEWTNEPDKITWFFPQHNLMAMIVRHPLLGHLCGYVGLPNNHPLYGVSIDDAPGYVHGHWTYADYCDDHICHKALPDEPNKVYWLGFDCAHYNDLSPGLPYTQGTYKNIYYVANEIAQVLEELS